MIIAFTILGECASKSNSRRLVRFGERIASIKSKKALEYTESAILQIPDRCKLMLEGPIKLTVVAYYASRRPDLDLSVLMDALQAKFKGSEAPRKLIRRGVYLNDRQLIEQHFYRRLDKLNPRCEIQVEELAE